MSEEFNEELQSTVFRSDEGDTVEHDEVEARLRELKAEVEESDEVPTLVTDESTIDPEALEGLSEALEETNESEVEDDPEASVEAAEAPQKREYPKTLIDELRRFDRKDNKTCAGCATRKPLSVMDKGKAELCPDCK